MKREYCSACGVDITGETKKHVGDDGSLLCDECYKKLLNEKYKSKYIDSLQSFPNNGQYNIPDREKYNSLIEYCIDFICAISGSDLHIKTGVVPTIRKGGSLFKICDEIVTNDDVVTYMKSVYHGSLDINDRMVSVDFSFDYKDVRFRANYFHDLRGYCLALRLIKLFSVDFEKLGLPKELQEIAMRKSGLILVTGPTGSGKSTSLAALLNYLNHHANLHILTLEDPVEYIHENHSCIISQREIGTDCPSYEDAIIDFLREDPDMIMIGEMRDRKSIEAALRAVETGHIVLSTLHTRGAVSTISRIVDIFPSDQQDQIRTQLSLCLLCVCSQQLLPSVEVGKQVLATEFLINSQPIAASIRDNRLPMISSFIHMGANIGMHTMKTSLDKLLAEERITPLTYDNYQIE